MLTEDENIIDVKFAVQYRLKDATEYLFNNRNPDDAVVQAAETAVREIVGRSKMDNVLYENREKLAVDLNVSIQKILDSYKAGIFVTSVTVQNVQPPEPVQAAFDDAVKAGQDRERLKNEGQAYANDIVPKAKGAADRLMQEAEGYKAKVVAVADGDATRFKLIQAEYAKAPQVTRDRMYIDTMQEIYTNVTKVLMDQKGNGNSLLYLPLDKLIQQVTPVAPSAVPSSNTVANTPANPAPISAPVNSSTPAASDKREPSGLRSRERDRDR
jgi:membrane protease subunit HflK